MSASQEPSCLDPGTQFRDTLSQEPEMIEKDQEDMPTASHELANAGHDEKGAA